VEFYVSAASICDMRFKWQALHRAGDGKSPLNPGRLLAALKDRNLFYLNLAVSIWGRALAAPILRKDPFDEMLLIQA